MQDPTKQIDNPYRDFNVDVTYTLTKKCKVNTDDYNIELDDFAREAFINTELTDWKTCYEDSHYTLKEMLDELRRYVEKDMCCVLEHSSQGRALKRLYNDLQDWEVIEEEFCEA